MIFGLMTQVADAAALKVAVKALRQAGYTRIEAYSPVPVEGLDAELGLPASRIPLYVLAGGVFGGVFAYGMQYYINTVSYALNIGGRPMHSWPSFIPVTFELVILCAALAALFSVTVGNGLPEIHHPVFHLSAFDKATTDGYFVCVEAADQNFDLGVTSAFLARVTGEEVHALPA